MIILRPNLRSQDGFTLVEVMTAVLILSIGLLGVGTLVISSMRTEAFNSRVRQAEYLASAKMEELRASTAGADLTTNDPSGEIKYPLHDGTESDIPGDNQVYVRKNTIESYNANNENMVLVRVVVGWPYAPTKSPDPCSSTSIEGCTYKYRMNATILQR